MKNLKFYTTALLLLVGLLNFAQVQVDHPIELTGNGTNAKLNGIQNVSSNHDAVSVDYIQRDSLKFAVATGSSNAYNVNLSPSVTGQYTLGMVVNFKANFANTGAATLNVNSLGADTIMKNYNSYLAANDIKSGQMVSVMYDGKYFQMLTELGNSGGGPVCKSLTAVPLIMSSGGSSVGITSNTSAFAEAVNISCTITVNEISFNVLSVSTAGEVMVGVYSEDGQTNLISVTSSNISAGGTVSIAVSGVTLTPGNYYIVMVPLNTANLSFGGTYCTICPSPAGKPVFSGTQTTSANALPATISPTALSSYVYVVSYQLEN